eukprot:gene18163-21724_t
MEELKFDKVSNEFTYRPARVLEPNYITQSIQPQGDSNFQINTNCQDTTFILSANKAYNLSRSWMQFTMTIPTGVANLKPFTSTKPICYPRCQ